MIWKYALPVIAALGLALGVYVVKTGAKPVPIAQPVAQPSLAPYKSYIAGAGIVEASTENIALGTPVAGVVTAIHVRVGQHVSQGDKLFEIDTRDLRAELAVRQGALKVAEAKVPEAEANLGDAKNQLTLYEQIGDERAVTKEEFTRRRFAVQAAQARLATAKADVASATAQVNQTEVEISRRIVTAPVVGDILQVKIHLGEFAQVGPLATPLMVMGDTDTVNVRTDIDENDAWRFSAGARAVAFVRGNPSMKTEVKFARVEPYVIPKRSLTGDTTERVDTRVLQILYSFRREQLPIYVGQQMDVFIEAPEASATSRPATALIPTTDAMLGSSRIVRNAD